jgi:hypothetical protein
MVVVTIEGSFELLLALNHSRFGWFVLHPGLIDKGGLSKDGLPEEPILGLALAVLSG